MAPSSSTKRQFQQQQQQQRRHRHHHHHHHHQNDNNSDDFEEQQQQQQQEEQQEQQEEVVNSLPRMKKKQKRQEESYKRQPFPQPSLDQPPTTSEISSHLFLMAHEASLIQGHSQLAKSIESPSLFEEDDEQSTSTRTRNTTRMIEWKGDRHDRNPDEELIWIDRYDALNLLSCLPYKNSITRNSTCSIPNLIDDTEIGFEDLGSDSEEMFYFEPKERKQILLEKKRKRLVYARQVRIEAIDDEEGIEVGVVVDEEKQKQELLNQIVLMKKLFSTLTSASEPALLEIRIMANHGRDSKFDFLRKGGKYHVLWEKLKRGELIDVDVQQQKEEENKVVREEEKDDKVRGGVGLIGLNDYGSDDDDDDESEEEEKVKEKEEKLRKAEKVKEWARKRKEAREKEIEAK